MESIHFVQLIQGVFYLYLKFRTIQSLYDMDFGKNLLPGEGVAMAEFVANGQVILLKKKTIRNK